MEESHPELSSEKLVITKSLALFDNLIRVKRQPICRKPKKPVELPMNKENLEDPLEGTSTQYETPEERALRLQKEDEENQKMLAEKYKDFEFIPRKVRFLSEDVIIRLRREIPRVNKLKYKSHFIYGHVDLVIDLENGTYKRYFLDFQEMTITEILKIHERGHLWDALIRVDDRTLMEIAAFQRDFDESVERGLVKIYGDIDTCRELKKIINVIIPTQYFRMPSESDFSESDSDDDSYPAISNRELMKIINQWKEYEKRKSDRLNRRKH